MIWLNENNPYAAQWLRNLIAKGHLPDGKVDARSILDLRPSDAGARQCHFFAGIGGWPLALDLAGWPRDREVWTASLPCQPLSLAGKREGAEDDRHLWPVFYRFVRERRPAVIFGEQVASKDGREWLAAVRADLEAIGYAVGAACLPACSVGAPHRRYRLFWVAHRCDEGREGRLSGRANPVRQAVDRHARHGGAAGGLGDADSERRRSSDGPREAGELRQPEGLPTRASGQRTGSSGALDRLADADGDGLRVERAPRVHEAGPRRDDAVRRGASGGLADAAGGQRRRLTGAQGREPDGQADGWLESDGEPADDSEARPWRDPDWLYCRDGKWRPIKSGLEPLVNGVPGRVGKLRAAGNAIVAQVAAEFIAAYLEEHPQ